MARHNRSKAKSFSTHYFVNILLFILYTAVTGMTLFTMYTYHFLAFRYLNVILTLVLGLVFLLSAFLTVKGRAKLVNSFLLVIFTVLSTITFLGFNKVVNLAGGLNNSTKYSEVEMSVVVPKDSSIKSVKELDAVEAPTQSDGTNIDEFIKQIKVDQSKNLSVNHVDSYAQAYSDLMAGSTQAIVLNSAYSSLIESQDKDFNKKVKKSTPIQFKPLIKRAQRKRLIPTPLISIFQVLILMVPSTLFPVQMLILLQLSISKLTRCS